jgi:hypothetical protein
MIGQNEEICQQTNLAIIILLLMDINFVPIVFVKPTIHATTISEFNL